jgi:PAS domain S-box-containing protein
MIRTIKLKLLLVYLLFTGLVFIVGFSAVFVLNSREDSFKIISLINNLSARTLSLFVYEENYINYESRLATYHLTHTSGDVESHQELLKGIKSDVEFLLKSPMASDAELKTNLAEIIKELDDYNKTFRELITQINERGIQIYGLEGQLNKKLYAITANTTFLDQEKISLLRENEKNYFFSRDSIYVYKIKYLIDDLKLQSLKNHELELLMPLDKYLRVFMKIVEVEKIIGYGGDHGLIGRLSIHNKKIRDMTDRIEGRSIVINYQLKKHYHLTLSIILSVALVIGFAMSLFFASALTKPIRKISKNIEEIIENDFAAPVKFDINTKDEVGILASNLTAMVYKIRKNIGQIRENSYQMEIKNTALSISELNFRSTFEQAAVGMAHVNFDGKWIKVNQRLCDVFGYEHSSLINISPFEITYPDDMPMARQLYNQIISGESFNYNTEYRFLHRSGKNIWVSLTVSIKYDNNNVPEYMIWVIQDISKRKVAEQELIYKNQELDTFFYKVSHDLKGPVASLKGLCMLSKIQISDSGAMEYIFQIEKSTNRLHEIISNLQELTKIKEGIPKSERLDIRLIINSCLESVNKLEGFERMIFEINDLTGKPFYADQAYVNSILQNVLENSIKYSRQFDNSFVRINVEDHKDGVLIIVSDNGIGIPSHLQKKIFDMFFRATTHSKGSGLGLYLVKNAVEKLKGTIDVQSIEGQGTSFYIFLPSMNEPVLVMTDDFQLRNC